MSEHPTHYGPSTTSLCINPEPSAVVPPPSPAETPGEAPHLASPGPFTHTSYIYPDDYAANHRRIEERLAAIEAELHAYRSLWDWLNRSLDTMSAKTEAMADLLAKRLKWSKPPPAKAVTSEE